jgi:Fic family protein
LPGLYAYDCDLMKMPDKPRSWRRIMEEKSDVIISASTDDKVAELVKKFNERYLHWDEVRYRDVPVDHEVLWALMKLSRRNSARRIPFKEWTFHYNITSDVMRTMHILDSGAGGTIEAPILGLRTAKDMERYIVSSLMEEAIASSQIEGAVTTTKVAKDMLKTQRRPRNVSEQMILNSYVAMKRIKELRSEELTIDLIKELHRIITQDTLQHKEYEGQFRKDNETVVGNPFESDKIYHRPPDHGRIEKYLQEVCDFANGSGGDFIHPLIKAITIHFMIGFIHPFVDGNGRLARTLLYWYALKSDYWLFEYMAISRVIKGSRRKYGMAYLYTETDDNDLTYFLSYNFRCMEKALQDVRAYILRKQEEQRDALRIAEELPGISARQAEILKYVMKSGRPVPIKEIASMFDVVYQTARTDLLGLVEIGRLDMFKDKRRLLFVERASAENV